MRLKLKEKPREWLKFTAVMALMMTVLSFLAYRRAFPFVLGFALLALIVCAIRPRWFRGFYRAGMTVSFHIGQVIGRVLLTVFFLVVVTPLGLLLRIFGKDLLQLKRPAGAA
ncbi:MAG TPA: SxtJ family membrane protein, partial [Candidatus Binatia bacterium]|nr:SxtJ family membrane protein [Candidatus Binatia bacterium]